MGTTRILVKALRFGLTLLIAVFFLGPDVAKAEVRLSIALFNSPATESLVKLVPNFEKETGIKVSVELLPYAELKAKVEQQFVTHAGTYDIIMADCIWIPSFAVRGFIAPMDMALIKENSYDIDDILPELNDYLGKYPKDGTQYGMPFMSNTQIMAYRPSIVKPIAESMGLKLPGDTPNQAWTWDQYLAVARKITAKYEKSTSRIYGTSLQARAGAWIVYEWYSELFGFVKDEAARVTGLPDFNAQAARAFDYYHALYNFAPRESLTWGHEEETASMCSGKTAMDATSNVELASNLLKQECTKNGGELAFAYPPVGVSGRGSPDMGGYGLLLSKDSTHVSEASRFILWATSKNIHHQIVMDGGSPIRRSELGDPVILKQQPYLRLYEAAIRDSVYRARIPAWPELQDVISRELTSVMTGDKKGTKAAASVEKWITDNNLRKK